MPTVPTYAAVPWIREPPVSTGYASSAARLAIARERDQPLKERSCDAAPAKADPHGEAVDRPNRHVIDQWDRSRPDESADARSRPEPTPANRFTVQVCEHAARRRLRELRAQRLPAEFKRRTAVLAGGHPPVLTAARRAFLTTENGGDVIEAIGLGRDDDEIAGHTPFLPATTQATQGSYEPQPGPAFGNVA